MTRMRTNSTSQTFMRIIVLLVNVSAVPCRWNFLLSSILITKRDVLSQPATAEMGSSRLDLPRWVAFATRDPLPIACAKSHLKRHNVIPLPLPSRRTRRPREDPPLCLSLEHHRPSSITRSTTTCRVTLFNRCRVLTLESA